MKYIFKQESIGQVFAKHWGRQNILLSDISVKKNIFYRFEFLPSNDYFPLKNLNAKFYIFRKNLREMPQLLQLVEFSYIEACHAWSISYRIED